MYGSGPVSQIYRFEEKKTQGRKSEEKEPKEMSPPQFVDA